MISSLHCEVMEMIVKGQKLLLHLGGEPVAAYISELKRLPGQSHHETTIFLRLSGDNAQLAEMEVPVLSDYLNCWKDRDLEAFIIKNNFQFQRKAEK